MKTLLLALVAGALAAPTAFAWNNTGHMLSAYVAYKRLSPGAKARVDGILRTHPDYPKWMAAAPPGIDRGLEAFLQASIWADVIKGDRRFWDPASRESRQPTPLLPGFPDMQQHRDWHYRDFPLSSPGAPAPKPREPNLVSQMHLFVKNLADPYKLVWFVHLAGDAHQPLHAVSRFTKPGDTGDRGGNLVLVDAPGARNLHEFWDEAAGTDSGRQTIASVGNGLLGAGIPPAQVARTDFETWMRESFDLARTFVYKVDGPRLPDEYLSRARQLARQRVALAGLRLAAILNERLQ